jgi:hypothetical protein
VRPPEKRINLFYMLGQQPAKRRGCFGACHKIATRSDVRATRIVPVARVVQSVLNKLRDRHWAAFVYSLPQPLFKLLGL